MLGVNERENNKMRREISRGQFDGSSKCCRPVLLATLTGIPSSSNVHIQGLVTLSDRDANIQPRRRSD